MTVRQYQTRFIGLFFIIKILLLLLTFFLFWGDAYTEAQMMDIRGLLFPTFAASLIIMLNYLRREEEKKVKVVSKTEYYIIMSLVIIYFVLIVIYLIQLNTAETAFKSMKNSITWIESFFGAILGWVISNLKSS